MSKEQKIEELSFLTISLHELISIACLETLTERTAGDGTTRPTRQSLIFWRKKTYMDVFIGTTRDHY